MSGNTNTEVKSTAETTTAATETKKTFAKKVNTYTVIGAIAWTVIMTLVKAFIPGLGITVGDIIKVALTLVAVVGGITGSIWLDKIIELKKGN